MPERTGMSSASNRIIRNRRQILKGSGVGAAMLLAGCSGLSGGEDGGDSNGAAIQSGKQAYSGTQLNGLLKEGPEAGVIADSHAELEDTTGMKISIEQYTEPKTHQKFVLTANNQADTYDFNATQHWYFPQFYSQEWLEPLGPYLEDHQADWLDFSTDDLYASSLKPYTRDGTLYGIPHSLLCGAVYYRKDVLEKLGLDAPETVKDVVQIAKEANESDLGIHGSIGRAAATFSSFGTWAGWAWAYGAKTLDENNKPQITSPEMKEAVNDYVTMLRDHGPKGAAGLKWTDFHQYLDNTAVIFDTSGFGTRFFEANGENAGSTLVTGPAGNIAQWLYSESLTIPKWIPEEKKGAAWQMLQWRESRNTVKLETKNQNPMMTCNKRIMNSDIWENTLKERNLWEHGKTVKEGKKKVNDEYWPYVPEFQKIGEAFMAEVSRAVDGQQSPEAACQNAQKEIDKIMKKAGYY